MPGPLEQASSDVLAAAQARDMEALAEALKARAEALASGEHPTPGVHAAGELSVQLLSELIRETTLESARLRRLGEAFAPSPETPFLDTRG